MILLVSYDLKTPDANYQKLYDVLQSAPHWWHFLESTWLLCTNEDVHAWQKKIKCVINANDHFIVIDVTRQNRNGWLPKKAWEWIRTHENP